MGCIRVYLQKMRHRMKLDLLRELGRQYPVFCFLLLVLLLSTVLLNRWVQIGLLYAYNVSDVYKLCGLPTIKQTIA